MRTSTPLAHMSPPAPRKPVLKRRRLNLVLDSGRALTDNSNGPLIPNGPSLSLCAKLSCSTCHRALSTTSRSGVSGLSICSRCAASTCPICARTCTSYTRPSSFPPTPALTRSPSPSTMTPISSKRNALGFSYAAMNYDTSLFSIKRKKPPIDKEDGDGDLDTSEEHNHHDTISMYDIVCDGTESVVVRGCGRVVCRTCCVESVPNDGKLCVDCFALV